MLRPNIIRTLAATVVAACLAVAPSLADERLETMHKDTLGTLLDLRKEASVLVSVETNFPAEFIDPWNRALDKAFDPEVVERELREAYERNLSEQAIAAALAFDQSPLGKDVYAAIDEVVVAAAEDENYWPDIVEFIDTAPTEVAAPYVDIFEYQIGARRGEVTMEGMYRIMAIAASAVGGPEFGQLWIETARADGYTEGYVRELFIMSVASFKRLPVEQLQEVVDVVAEPGMVAYTEEAHRAFEQTYNAAIDRLEDALAEELATR